MGKLLFTVVFAAASVAVAAPAAAHDDPRPHWHERQHERLERQHDRAHDRLEDVHDEAHYYGVSRREHRRLHRYLERRHDGTHDRLERRHERQHDRWSDRSWRW